MTYSELRRQTLLAFEPWTLACATAAWNHTDGMGFGYDLWLDMSTRNWMPGVQARLPFWAPRFWIKHVLVGFAASRPYADVKSVLREVEQERGLPSSVTLGPGESITFGVQVTVRQGVLADNYREREAHPELGESRAK